MNFHDFWKRFVAFGLTFSLGLFTAAFLRQIDLMKYFRPEIKVVPIRTFSLNNGNGASGPDFGPDDPRNFRNEKFENPKNELATGVEIIHKPRAFDNIRDRFNEERLQALSGKKVVLRVTFLASGEIGAISVIAGLPEGLTEKAVEAARGIKFKPATRGGVPYTVTKPVEYPFGIY